MARPLPSGRCHFQNPNLKTSDYNTSCQCQTFWLDALADASLSTITSDDRELVLHQVSAQKPIKNGAKESRQSTPAPRYGFCVCGHHACFHDASPVELKDAKYNQSTLETEKERTANSFQTAKQSPSKAVSEKADHLHHSATTVDDNAPTYATNVRDDHDTGNRGDWTRTSLNSDGLGLSITTTRDEPSNNATVTCGRHHLVSEQSSAATEVMPHINFPSGYHHNLQIDTFRDEAPRDGFYSGVPIFQSPRLRPHLQIQRLTPRIQQYGSDRSSSTVADSPYFTHYPGLLAISRQAMSVVNALNTISSTLLPSHLQNRQIAELHSSATSVDSAFQHVSIKEDNPYFADEVTRKAVAAEEAARDLLQCIEQSTSQFSQTLLEEPQVPQISQTKHQSMGINQLTSVYPGVNPPSGDELSSPDSLRSMKSKQSVLPAILSPLVVSAKETSIHNTLRNQIMTLMERLQGMEDNLEDTANKAELAEDRVVEMENRVVNVEDKVDNVAESFSKHKDENLLRKRIRDEQEDDGDSQDHYISRGSSAKKKRKKRRKHNMTVEDTSALPVLSKDQSTLFPHALPTIKQTTTTTRTSFTSTSFTSASSHGSSVSTRHKTHSLLSNVLLQLDSLSTRIAALEFISAPTLAKPWTVQIVVLPPSVWSTWKKKDNVYSLNNGVPKAPMVGSKAWKRLESRGLIKTVDVTGGEARDFERVIRKNFGSIFKALNTGTEDEDPTGNPWEWSPLRKIPKQATLRYLNVGEMDKGFWKVDFIKGTCSTSLTTPAFSATATSNMPLSDPLTPSKSTEAERQEPTHRLWITNCWTGCMSNSSEDITRENTQISSADQSSNNRKFPGSVTSTQKSMSSLVREKRKFNASQADEDVLYARSILTNCESFNRYGGGWDEIKALHMVKPPIYSHSAGNGGNFKSSSSDPYGDFWHHDVVLDGPLTEIAPPTSSGRISGEIVEPTQPTRQYVSRIDDALSDSDTSFSRTKLVKTWSADDIPEPLNKQPAEYQHIEPLASQASLYGFGDSPVRGEDILINENDEEEPLHTLHPSTISHDSALTLKALAATPGYPSNSHPKQLKRRLEDLQEYLTENSSLNPSLLRYNSPYEYNEERCRESRSPTVEDDPPASLVSHQTASNHASNDPTSMTGTQHNSATNRHLSPHYPAYNAILSKAASFDVSQRLTRSSSAADILRGKPKMWSQD